MSVNKLILVGNVGKDPEVKHLDGGSSVANFTLAVTEKGYTSRAGKDIPENTEWFNIVCWRGLAKLSEDYIKKGMKLYIEGKVRTRKWEDQNGIVRYTTEVFADNIEMPQRQTSIQEVPKQELPQEDAPPVGEKDGLPF